MATTYKKYLEQRLKKISDEAKGIAEEMEAKFTESNEVPSELKEKFDRVTAEGAEVRKSLEALSGLKDLTDFVDNPAGTKLEGDGLIRSAKSLGSALIESADYKNRDGRFAFTAESGYSNAKEAKALYSGSGDGMTQYDRQSGIIMVEQQRLTIADLLAQGRTNSNTIRYVRETSFTNAATTVAEGGLKPEATFALEEADAPVRKVAVTAKVTDETFADFPQLRSYIDNRLMFMVEQREEDQILNGTGVAPNLTGLLGASILTQAIGTDALEDAIYKAITKIRTTGFFEPDGVVIHPNDFQALKLKKDANNQYLGGGYFTGAYGQPYQNVDRLWGLPAVITTAISAGDPLVGAFRVGAQVFYRDSMTVESTNSNEDDFKYNRVAIRAEQRMALAVYRPSAFCQVLTP